MDRQDIDALLIGALYGELTPADEARLSAHLESHPADRGALEGLKVTRQSILDSRIFAVQVEPPQAVSALLLQEAHRRAPKRVVAQPEKEGWFYRFTRSFMAHPAMAAAAMLVLVLGGAGIVYMKKGDTFAEKQAPSAADTNTVAVTSPAPEERAREEAPPAAEGAAAPGTGVAQGSAFQAGVYENEDKKDSASDQAVAGETASAAQQQALAAPKEALKKAPSRGIAVSTSKGAVRELDAVASKNDALGFDDAREGGAGAAVGGASDRGFAPAPPPPAAAPAKTSTGRFATNKAPTTTTQPRADAKPAAPPAEKTIAKPAEAPKQEAKAADASLVAWAKGEHQRAIALAQRGECSTAAKVALGVSTRASEYYAQYMATDRALKQCAAYINAERDREAERSGKARAQKRVNAEEPAPSTLTK